jgi:hypothetical protein
MLVTAAPTKLLQIGGVRYDQHFVASLADGGDSKIGEYLTELSSTRRLHPQWYHFHFQNEGKCYHRLQRVFRRKELNIFVRIGR